MSLLLFLSFFKLLEADIGLVSNVELRTPGGRPMYIHDLRMHIFIMFYISGMQHASRLVQLD